MRDYWAVGRITCCEIVIDICCLKVMFDNIISCRFERAWNLDFYRSWPTHYLDTEKLAFLFTALYFIASQLYLC
jgi:hypothetical protein